MAPRTPDILDCASAQWIGKRREQEDVVKSLPAAGGMLGIKPLITIKEGKVVMAGKARGLPGAYVALFKKIEELGGVNPRFPSLAGYCLLYTSDAADD